MHVPCVCAQNPAVLQGMSSVMSMFVNQAANPPTVLADVRKGEQILVGDKIGTIPGENLCQVRGPKLNWNSDNIGEYADLHSAMVYANEALLARLLLQEVPEPTGIDPQVYEKVKANAMVFKKDVRNKPGVAAQVRKLILYNILVNNTEHGEGNAIVNNLAHLLLLSDYETWKECKRQKKELPQSVKDKLTAFTYPAIFTSFKDVESYINAYVDHRKVIGLPAQSPDTVKKISSGFCKLFWCCGMNFDVAAETPSASNNQCTPLTPGVHTIKIDALKDPIYPLNFFAGSVVKTHFNTKMAAVFGETLQADDDTNFHGNAAHVPEALNFLAKAFHLLCQQMSRKQDLLLRHKTDTKYEVPHRAMSFMSILMRSHWVPPVRVLPL